MGIRAAVTGLDPVQQHAIARAVARLCSEFKGQFSPESIERLLLDSVDRLLLNAQHVSAVPVLAERFTRQRLKAQGALGRPGPPTLLFVCGHNSGRSQLAAGLCRSLFGDSVVVYTGGTDPGRSMEAGVVDAMAELGIDISDEFPKPLTIEVMDAADVVVTMGCGDACPVFPGKRYEDWPLDDPAGQGVDAVRPIRDEIEKRVRVLLASLGID